MTGDLGITPLRVRCPLLAEVSRLNSMILLLNLVFNIILLVFVGISTLLIYSLLMIGVETKTHETGIMRMVGISKHGLVQMVFIQSLMFVLPAMILGFALCPPLLAVLYSKIFQVDLTDGFEPVPEPLAVVFGLLVGLFIPLASSIYPVMKILG